MTFNLAYLSGGKLHLKLGDAAVQNLESEFGESLRNSRRQIQQRNAWKSDPRAGLMPQGAQATPEEAKDPVMLTGLCPGKPQQLFYSLSSGEMGGILALNAVTHPSSENGAAAMQPVEKRLFHSAEFRVRDLSHHPDQELIACSVVHPSGEANIATMKANGIRPNEVTEGDSIDAAPSWILGTKKAMVYQSAGVARNAEGYVVAVGPFAIEKLDFENRSVDTLAQDEQYDYLSPQMTADGTLYYIRRPYKKSENVGFFQLLKDIVLMPFRLLIALFELLNLFYRVSTGKELIKKSDNQPQIQGMGHAVLLGQPINTTEQAKRNQKFDDEDSPALVPREWMLMRRRGGEEATTVARGVVDFHVNQEGAVVYTNGSAIYGIVPGGVAKRLLKEKGRVIEQVTLLTP